MRNRFAKYKRSNLLRQGAKIITEKWIKEPGWKRKDIGYEVIFLYNGLEYHCASHDKLSAYQLALESTL